MNKPLSLAIKETKTKIINACNESQLSVVILDLIMKDIYTEVHLLAENQALEEQSMYSKAITKNDGLEGDNNESE